MIAALGAFASALLVATALTPVVRMIARRLGVVDRPGGRRVNTSMIPRLGGIAVVLAFYAPLLVLFGTESEVAEMFFATPWRIVGLAAGGFLVAGLGVLDDVIGVRAWHKLIVQTAAAMIAWGCGFRMEAIGLPFIGPVEFGVFSAPLTVFWIVAIVNALNLIDGLDGLAAGISFFACVTNFVVAAISGNPLVMLLSACLAGSILGFLLYNFNPATIFMGDSGSMFLGFVLATMSMMGASIQGSTTVAILVPILSLGVPIMDTLFAMLRRILERRPIFSPDRGHIHHRLLDLGITHRRAVLILYGVTFVFTAGAITVALGRNWQVGIALLLLTVAMLGLARFVGYFEYLQIRRRQRERIRSRSTERLRAAVPLAIARIDSLVRVDDLTSEIAVLGKAAELTRIEIVIPPGVKAAASCTWTADESDIPLGQRECVRASFPLTHVADGAAMKFAWLSDDGEVSPQADILLQLIADACDRRISRAEIVRTAGATHLRSIS